MSNTSLTTKLADSTSNEIDTTAQVTRLRQEWQWATDLQNKLSTCLESFWHTALNAQLVGISDRMQYFWEFEDFYVSQKNLFASQDSTGFPMQLRLHYQFCSHFFQSALGPQADNRAFKLSELTPFEIFTLEKLSIQLFSVIQTALGKVNRPQTTAPATTIQLQNELSHILWYVSLSPEQEKFPLVISIPTAILEQAITTIPVATLAKSEQYADEQFLLNCYAAGLHFRIGSTRASLTEMQELTQGDIIVLENSNLKQWLLWHDKRQTWVSIPIAEPKGTQSPIPKYKPLNSAQSALSSGDSNAMKTQSPQSFHWENLQVDLVASFEPLKFPIKRLKEISEGLVLEVSGLTENSININVDGQPVAWGELVIVGDKFAVRIQGVYEHTANNASNAQDNVHYATHPQHIEAPAQQPAQAQPSTESQQPQAEENRPENNFLQDLNLDESDFDDLDENNEL